jgi:hypothetical protein
MSTCRQTCSVVFPILFLAAGCGAVKSAAGVAPPIHNDTFEAVLGHGDFADRSSNAECLALRLKIDLSRNAFEGSSEMSSVISTPQWEALDTAYDAFKDADCPTITADHANVSDTCTDLGEDVAKAWNGVQDTAAWETAGNNTDLQDLLRQWQQAKSLDCLAQ